MGITLFGYYMRVQAHTYKKYTYEKKTLSNKLITQTI